MNCKLCNLHKTRRTVVCGEGSTPADVLFLGDGPNQIDDAIGIPFAGQAGKLIFENIYDITYYVANIIFCHPTDSIGGKSRQPTKDEVLACFDNVSMLYEKVNPKITIFLGNLAEHYYKNLFKPNSSIHHPSFILRTGGKSSPYYNQTINKLKDIIDEYI